MQQVSGIQFNVGNRYEIKKLLGAGAYGHVALAIDKKQIDPSQQKVAIKKLHIIKDEIDAKRVLREIRILRTMQHENILLLMNLIYDDSSQETEFGEVYLVTNYLEVDLYRIIKSGQNLTDQHYQYILYQLFKGLKYLHSANIVHRDIKPSNILATENCEICFCDFGLARQIEESEAEDNRCQQMLTEYVVTRYYRAPEVMLSSHEYSTSIDIWSLGCTFAELLTRQILFKGTNYIQMIKMIFETLGKPPDEDLNFISNANAKKYVNSLQSKPKQSVAQSIKYQNPQALDLLDKMLEINPKKRITAEQALEHPYLDAIRDADDEPTFEGQLDCTFENDPKITFKDLSALILNEVNLMKQKNQEPIINVTQELEKREQIAKQTALKKQAVGLTLAHLLSKFKLDYKIYEKKPIPSAHPSAHYINMRSMEILNNINIKLQTEDFKEFCNYAYVRRVGEEAIKIRNQTIDTKQYCLNGYAHLPQNEFVGQLSQGIDVNYGKELVDIKLGEPNVLLFKDIKNGQIEKVECEKIIGCDGLNGFVRDKLQIKLQGNRNIQKFLNVHFESQQLISILEQYKSMLTFIYNSDITAVIIKHSIQNKTFAIQIPLDLLTFQQEQINQLRQDVNLIKDLINKCLITKINDIQIKSIGLWQMGAVVAEQYQLKNKCVLVGDACHGMPPAGGFGMNTGIQDAHNLAFKLINNDNLEYYEQERQQIAKDNINIALKYYQKSLNIAQSLGFNYNNLKLYQQVMQQSPSLFQSLYKTGIKIGGSLIEFNPIQQLMKINEDIPLVFPKEEIQFKYNQGNIKEGGGALAPLEIRRQIRKYQNETNNYNKWFIVNCQQDNLQELQMQDQIKMIVRNDEHIFQYL